jgi:TPR repeat protein
MNSGHQVMLKGFFAKLVDAIALKLSPPLAKPEAQYSLGYMYFYGMGVPQNYKKAARWCRKAAEQGNAMAQGALGFMYMLGKGVPQDYGEAARWSRLGAEQGDAMAQNNLSFLYYSGMGIPQERLTLRQQIPLSV